MKVFLFDSTKNKITINQPEILLVKEFNDLFEADRTKSRELLYKQFTYIWLMWDWESPYSQYSDIERRVEALRDSGLREKDLESNDKFIAASRKYKDLQESSRAMKLIKSAQSMVDKLVVYFDTLDLSERDPLTNKPIYKTKDVMAEMQSVSKVVAELQTLEELYKKQKDGVAMLRGGAEEGFDPGDF